MNEEDDEVAFRMECETKAAHAAFQRVAAKFSEKTRKTLEGLVVAILAAEGRRIADLTEDQLHDLRSAKISIVKHAMGFLTDTLMSSEIRPLLKRDFRRILNSGIAGTKDGAFNADVRRLLTSDLTLSGKMIMKRLQEDGFLRSDGDNLVHAISGKTISHNSLASVISRVRKSIKRDRLTKG